jgi:hypothetical protein
MSGSKNNISNDGFILRFLDLCPKSRLKPPMSNIHKISNTVADAKQISFSLSPPSPSSLAQMVMHCHHHQISLNALPVIQNFSYQKFSKRNDALLATFPNSLWKKKKRR